MIELTIDNQKVGVEPGTTILEAALRHGIYIPNLCYDPRLKPYGGCRLCLVEVQGQRKLIASCATPVKAEMVVLTNTPKIAKVRKTLLELLLLHHPLDCPVCDKAGECKLQDLVFLYGASQSRFSAVRRQETGLIDSPLIARTMSRCILCGKCVKLCHDHQGARAVNFIGRGFKTKVSPAFEETLDCDFCGQCIDACPVGALGSGAYRSRSRIWYEEEHATICPYCGCGCTTHLFIREGRIMRARGKPGTGINNGDLCAKGRFGFDFIYGETRLTTPLIKKDGKHTPASWEEALTYIAKKLDTITQEHGPSAIGALGSPRCTMEDNYMLQRFMRQVIGSDNIDSIARFGHATVQMAINQILGVRFHPIVWDAPQKADLILVLESDITSMLPVWGLNFIRAKNHEATLIVADALDTKLAKNSSQWLQIRPGSGEYLLKGMMKILIDEREPLRRQAAQLPNFDTFIDSIEKFTPSFVSSLTGLTEQEITELARVYADSERRLLAITLGPSENKKGLNTLRSAANLVLLMGDDPATLQIPAELCNTLGMWAMGIHPLADGKDAYDMLYKGRLEALYIMGENPLVTFKNSELVELNLRGLEMLVVQDINYTDTARLGDVILPACSWGEKDGTFMNATGHVQEMRRLLPQTGGSLPDWQIFRDLARVMNNDLCHIELERIREDVGRLVTEFRRSAVNPPALYPVRDRPREVPDEDYPLILVTSDLPQHSGTLSVESRNLGSAHSDAYLRINPADAVKYNVSDDDFVRLSSRRGEVYVKARITSEVMEGMVFVPIHFPHVRINSVTHVAMYGEAPLDAVRVDPLD